MSLLLYKVALFVVTNCKNKIDYKKVKDKKLAVSLKYLIF